MFKYLKGVYSNGINIGHIRRRRGSMSECCCVYFEHRIYRKLHVCCQQCGATRFSSVISRSATNLLPHENNWNGYTKRKQQLCFRKIQIENIVLNC